MNIGVIFGSRNAEHDVSITSAYAVMKGLRKTGKYNIFPIYITQSGKWIYNPDFEDINNFKNLEKLEDTMFEIDFSSIGKLRATQYKKGLFSKKVRIEIDVVFPVLHGLNGEDGSLQGMLDMLHVPYASTSMLGSAVGMNKIIMKDIFKAHGLPITNHLVFNTSTVNIEQIEKKLNYPLFVKPSSLGSSIGISKVDNREELTNAIETAFYYDHDIIVEEGVPNLIELNCSVMEKNGEIITTLVEQPVSKGEFLSFEEKYTSSDGGTMQGLKDKVKIPADIPEQVATDIQTMTKTSYQILKCEGGAPRVDWLYNEKDNMLYINEINTIPGALQVHLWEKSGILVPEFLESMIATAIQKSKSRELNIDFKSNIIDHTIAFTK